MTSLAPRNVQIPFETYQRLLNHLSVHATTDAWAHELLSELEAEAKPVLVSLDADNSNIIHPLY